MKKLGRETQDKECKDYPHSIQDVSVQTRKFMVKLKSEAYNKFKQNNMSKLSKFCTKKKSMNNCNELNMHERYT